MVPSEGVEPPCLAALGSKPSVSANSTNWALKKVQYNIKENQELTVKLTVFFQKNK
jgi:hypothetical protein